MMKILCVGDIGLDEYVSRKEIYIGGCAFNVYQSLRAEKKALLCPFGDDLMSKKIRALIVEDKSIHLPFFSGPPSRQTLNILDSGEKNFLKFYPGPWDKWRASEEDLRFIKEFDLCHTVIYEQNVLAVNSYLKDQKWAIDFTTMRDFNEDIQFVKEYLPYLRFAFFGLDRSQSKLKEELIKLFYLTNIELVMTFGAEGSEVHFGRNSYVVKALPVSKVIDTTGAGDAYIGAYLSSRLLCHDVLKSMHLASARASEVVQVVSLGQKFRIV
jgi:sugar/nucleoside kinase (ribokinase family)